MPYLSLRVGLGTVDIRRFSFGERQARGNCNPQQVYFALFHLYIQIPGKSGHFAT